MNLPRPKDTGFTVVEVIITLFVGVAFIMLLNTLSLTIIRGSVAAQNQAVASSLAYAYLRKYAFAGAQPSNFNFSCTTSNDVTQGADPTGSDYTRDGTLLEPLNGQTIAPSSLPQPVSYSVIALAPYGCLGTVKPPILIRATVSYGPSGITVSHATYVGYGQ